MVHNSFPKNSIDHINGVKTDNRISNLRDVSAKENQRNRPLSCLNTSGYTGITWLVGAQKWRAQITLSGRSKYLGRFEKFCDAVKARKEAEVKYGFHPNHGRTA